MDPQKLEVAHPLLGARSRRHHGLRLRKCFTVASPPAHYYSSTSKTCGTRWGGQRRGGAWTTSWKRPADKPDCADSTGKGHNSRSAGRGVPPPQITSVAGGWGGGARLTATGLLCAAIVAHVGSGGRRGDHRLRQRMGAPPPQSPGLAGGGREGSAGCGGEWTATERRRAPPQKLLVAGGALGGQHKCEGVPTASGKGALSTSESG